MDNFANKCTTILILKVIKKVSNNRFSKFDCRFYLRISLKINLLISLFFEKERPIRINLFSKYHSKEK